MFIILASLFIVAIIISQAGKKRHAESENALEEFFAREHEANNTRKQPLDDLNYVEVPLSFIPQNLIGNNEQEVEYYDTLQRLSTVKIVNLTGYTNTDLKLQYGVGNLALLMSYDDNYTTYARTIYALAKLYYENGYESNACILLEKAVESGTDIKGNYTLLADIYQKKNEQDKLQALLNRAHDLRSASKAGIIHALEEYVHTN